jgi:hypothetical protein
LTQNIFPLLAFCAERALALRWSTDRNHWWQKMLRILKTESSKFPVRVLFPTGFTPRGTSQGSKEVVASVAIVMTVGVGVGMGEGDSLKTCGRIENSRARCLEEPACPKSQRVWEAAVDVVGSTSLVLNSTIHSLMRSLRKVSGSVEGLGGVGEWEG